VEELFKIMNELREKGIGMIYISHRMDEINRISDRVTVMRDGEYVDTVETASVTKDDIVRMMVGRVIMGDKKEKSNVPADAPVVLEVKNLNAGKEVKNVSFTLRKGEILGFAGLMGAGRTEVARALYGADAKQTGEIFLNGKKGAQVSAEYNAKLRTKTPSMEQLLKNLSGGNQQKVIIARWLMKNSDIFIFDEPTRGIDVGAKSEIYTLIEDLVAQGKSVIVISSELAEVQRLSDRVIVMCEGRITGELDIADASQEEIMRYATMRE
jgi:ribose transport system ATP-binding protein